MEKKRWQPEDRGDAGRVEDNSGEGEKRYTDLVKMASKDSVQTVALKLININLPWFKNSIYQK